MYPAAPCEICAVPVFPETWNCLLPAGLASPSPTTFRRDARSERVLEELQINVQGKIADSGKEVWGNTHSAPQAVVLESRSNMQNFVPSVIGMGAKDAVYLLESKGLKVNLVGVGKVKSQSIANGTIVKKGQTVTLTLN